LKVSADESKGAAYDPVASLRGALAFQKTRKKTEKLLR
jgi:hypothetical protein